MTNSDIHRFFVSEDGYLCTLFTSGKVTLLRLVPFSNISKVVLCQIPRYIIVFLLCLKVVVDVTSSAGKLHFVCDVPSADFVNDFTDFQVTVHVYALCEFLMNVVLTDVNKTRDR